MMDAADPASLRAEHDQLMARLSARRSMEHFAHAAISLFVAVIVGGASTMLFWEEGEAYAVPSAVGAALAVGLLAYAWVRYLRGRSARAAEHREFERLSALRRSLGIDDPSAMLPR